MSTRYEDYYKNHYKSTFTEADINEWLKWFDRQWRLIGKKVKLKQNLRVLEIGPGFGGFYQVLQQEGIKFDYIGLDLDPDIVKFTNDYFKTDKFRYQSIEDIKDKEGFDLIVAFEVLEHVDNPGEVAKKIFDLLKPKGIFCATTPYPFRRNIVSDSTHVSVLHPENWKRLFSLAGFKTVDYYPMSFAPLFWRISKRLNIRIPYYLPVKSFVSTSLIIARKK
jgi:2-polyprenyl-3-methyl-5-hydroxy-6-metoxy-1,4-benzoquinol methylase